MDRVIVCTVTYNSSGFLDRLVKAVSSQSVMVEKIVAVDNASSDEHANKNRLLAEEFPRLEIVHSKENLGGAGGFQKGIEHILEKNYAFDWVWIMDDDAFPREDCLENLLKYKQLDGMGALCPLIYGVELKRYQLYHHTRVNKYLNRYVRVAENVEELDPATRIEANAFVGPLVKRTVVEDVGIPDGSLFIYGDDTEYIYRISRKYAVYLIRDAVINHRDVINAVDEFNLSILWKVYYQYRNRLLFIEKYNTSSINGIIGKVLVLRDVSKEMLHTVKTPKYKGYRIIRLKCLYKAIGDAMKKRSGKIIDPAEFMRLISD